METTYTRTRTHLRKIVHQQHHSLNNQFGEYVNRGHSGVYVQDGSAYVIDSNVSYNTFTGISGSAQDGCRIVSFANTVSGNEPNQTQLPQLGSPSRNICRVVSYENNDRNAIQRILEDMEEMEWDEIMEYVSNVEGVEEMELFE